jgi:hypothetical protein
MATAWQIIFREVAKHANAFASGSASTVSANYSTSPLTVTQVEDPFFSLDFIKDKCIDAHGRLAVEIANVRAHPWRAWIGNTRTATISSGAVLPTVGTNSKSIVGAWGQVVAGGTGVLMSEAAPERVRDYLEHSSTLYGSPYLYYIDGNRIYHTETTVLIDCCTYERADVVTVVAANGDITLPDVLVDAIVAGAVAELIVEAKGIEQASYFLNVFNSAIDSIRKGQTTMPMMTLKATA